MSTTRNPESGFYLHGDFNCHISVASKVARRRAAGVIKWWLKDFLQFLEKVTREAEEELPILETIVEKIKIIQKEGSAQGE